MQPIPKMTAPVAAGTIFETTKERIGCRAWLMALKNAELFSHLNEFMLNVGYWYIVFGLVSVQGWC